MVSLSAITLPSFDAIATVQIVFLLTLSSFRLAHADNNDREKEFCPVEATIDLTHAKKNDSGFLANDGLFFPRVSARFRAGAWHGCICDIKPCLAFCAREKMTRNGTSIVAEDYVKHSAIPSVYHENLSLVDDEDTLSPGQRFHIFVRNPCQSNDRYFLEPEKYETDKFHLLKNGILFLPRRPDQTSRLNFKQYCLGQRDNNTIYTPMGCYIDGESGHVGQNDNSNEVVYICGLVAVPFLIATVIVYSILPEFRTIHGKTLRWYLCCLALLYAVLAVDRVTATALRGTTFCFCRVLTIYFLILATFLWLNVMCFDLWWKFGHFGSFQSTSDYKKFVGYSIYVWGITAIMIAVCFGMEFSPSIPESIRPGFMGEACWFKTYTLAAWYLYGPVSVTVASNVCLFVSTSLQVYKHNKNTQRHLNSGESRCHNDTKQWFSLHMNLFFVMGVTWSADIIFWLWKGPKYFWLVAATVNSLQGILIFVIFVCKASVWRSLKKRYNNKMLGCITCTSPNSLSGSLPSPETSVINEPKILSACSENSSQMIQMKTLNQPVVV